MRTPGREGAPARASRQAPERARGKAATLPCPARGGSSGGARLRGGGAVSSPLLRRRGTKRCRLSWNPFRYVVEGGRGQQEAREHAGDLVAFRVHDFHFPDVNTPPLLDDPGARPDVSAGAAKKVDRQVGCCKTHLAVEIRGQREGDRSVSQRREDSSVHGPRSVGDLLPVRKAQDRPVRLQLLEARLEPGQCRRGVEPQPQTLQKIGGKPGGRLNGRAHQTLDSMRKNESRLSAAGVRFANGGRESLGREAGSPGPLKSRNAASHRFSTSC